MNYLLLLPILYAVFFVTYALVRTLIPKSRRILFCLVCTSWFSVFIISIFYFPFVITVFLMGMSFTGISYRLIDYLKNKDKNFVLDFFIIQLLLTILGLAIIKIYGGI